MESEILKQNYQDAREVIQNLVTHANAQEAKATDVSAAFWAGVASGYQESLKIMEIYFKREDTMLDQVETDFHRYSVGS